jgi:hypothetical protein
LVTVVVVLVVIAVVVPGALMVAGIAAGYIAPVAMSAFIFGAPHDEDHLHAPVDVEREATLVP